MNNVLRIVEYPPPRKSFKTTYDSLNHLLWWMVALILFMGPLMYELYTSFYYGLFQGTYGV